MSGPNTDFQREYMQKSTTSEMTISDLSKKTREWVKNYCKKFHFKYRPYMNIYTLTDHISKTRMNLVSVEREYNLASHLGYLMDDIYKDIDEFKGGEG